MNDRPRRWRHLRSPWAALALGIAVAAGAEPTSAMAGVCRRDYPLVAQRLNEEGTTIVSFDIAVDGTVSNVTVSKSSGFADLDDAAVSCASEFHFKPAMKDGVPVAVHWKTEFNWTLKK